MSFREILPTFLSRYGFGLMICFVSGIVIMLISCGEGMETPITMKSEGVAGKQDRVPMAPQAPGAGIPFVKEVGYYHDHKWTQPLTDVVPAGETIFIKVVFSEGMKLKVSDTQEARPILYYKIGGKLTRFRIAGFGAKGKDFVSGDAKPIKTQATYLCKYVVQPQDQGVFTAAIGKLSTDRQGNAMNAFYTHKETLRLRIPKPTLTPKPTPEPKPTLTPKPTLPSPGTLVLVPARDSGTRGDNITNHTDIIIAGKLKKKPPQGTTIQLYHNGNAVPDAIDNTIDSKNRWAVSVVLPEGTHTLTARSEKDDKVSEKTEPLILTVDTTTPTADATAHLNGNILIAEIAGEGVAAYRYAVVIGECDENTVFSEPVDVRTVLNADISAFPAGTLSLCIIGEDSAGNQQTVPTVAQIEKVTPALTRQPEPEPEPEPKPATNPQDGPPKTPEAETPEAETPPETEPEPEPATDRQDVPPQTSEVETPQVDTVIETEPETDLPPPHPPGAEATPGEPPPVPVELSHFRPARNKETGAVVITWATQSELNNAGFFIKRSQQKNGEFKVINATMIPGAGTTSNKQVYTYTDTTAQPKVVYYYQIEDVSLDGKRRTLTRGIRLKGHVGAAGKATMIWGALKSARKE